MTFIELYEKEKRNRPNPAADFIEKVAEVTSKSPLTVKRWVQPSTSVRPDMLTQKVLADYFGTTPEELFPQEESK